MESNRSSQLYQSFSTINTEAIEPLSANEITMDEALAMNLDANTDKEPSSYYIYDQVTSPGTYHRGN